MSVGGSYSQNSSGSKSWYAPARTFINEFIPTGKTALAASQPADNQYTDQARQLLADNVAGKNLNPAANPTLAPYVSSLENEANTNLDANLADIQGRSNAGGMLLSSAANRNAGAAVNTSQQNLTNTIANLYNKQYDTALANQEQSIAPLIANSDPEYARALQLMQTFGGMGSSHASGMGVSVSGSAGGAGGAGG